MAEPLRFTAIDHISLTVANQQGALDFYSRLFGAELRKESASERYYVRIGSSYIALGQAQQGRRSGYIDHFCAGCEGVWLKPIEDRLKEIGVMYTSPPPFGIFFTDPDGIRIQLWTGDSWLDVARTAPVFTKSAAQPALFEPVRIDSLDIAVPDPDKAVPYYDRLFGLSVLVIRGASSVNVYKLGKSDLTLHSSKEGASLNSAVIRVKQIANGDRERLKDLGATVDAAVDRKRIAFSDPDGVRISLISTEP